MKLLRKGLLNLGMKECKCYEHIDILKCKRCLRIEHTKNRCTYSEKCDKSLAENHNRNNCESLNYNCVDCN